MDDEPELIPPSPKKQANYQVGDCVLAKSTVSKFMVNFTMGIIKGGIPFRFIKQPDIKKALTTVGLGTLTNRNHF